MAYLHGKGSYNGRSLIVELNLDRPVLAKEDKGDFKKGDVMGYFLAAQVDQSLMNSERVSQGKGPKGGVRGANGITSIDPQTNPYLVSQEVAHPEGGTYVGHETYYTANQVASIIEAAGDNVFTDDRGKTVLGIQADLTQNANNQLIINTAKPLGPTKNSKFDSTVLERQKAVTQAAREHRDAVLEEKQNAPRSISDFKDMVNKAQAETPAAETSEPEVKQEAEKTSPKKRTRRLPSVELPEESAQAEAETPEI